MLNLILIIEYFFKQKMDIACLHLIGNWVMLLILKTNINIILYGESIKVICKEHIAIKMRQN